MNPKFSLGHIVATPNALECLTPEDIQCGIQRHQSGNWGEMCDSDRQENDLHRVVAQRTLCSFLLGFKGEDKGIKVCRDEKFTREPSLQMALAYEAIYGRPVRELFAGMYQQVEQEVADRAKILNYRQDRKPNQKRHQALTNLVSKAIA